MDRVKWLTVFVLTLLIALGIYGGIVYPDKGTDVDYGLLYDAVFFSLLVFFLYFTYDRFNQNLLSYSLQLFLILLHCAGALWFYGIQWGWLQFDMIMHFVGGFILSYFFYRYVHFIPENYEYKRMRLFIIVLLCVLGISVFHELIEFFGYNLLGEGTGVLQYGAGDFGEYNDILIDLLMNIFGAIPGVLSAMKFGD